MRINDIRYNSRMHEENKNHSCVYILSNISNIVAHNKPEEEIAVIHPQ